jgi:hypothetical protein
MSMRAVLSRTPGFVRRKLRVPQATVRAAWLLRLAGFTVGNPATGKFIARADCRIDVMRLPPAARSIVTGQPVRQARMPLVSWARVFLWRLAGRL